MEKNISAIKAKDDARTKKRWRLCRRNGKVPGWQIAESPERVSLPLRSSMVACRMCPAVINNGENVRGDPTFGRRVGRAVSFDGDSQVSLDGGGFERSDPFS